MDEHTKADRVVEGAVRDIKKEFVVVGKGRVHGWRFLVGIGVVIGVGIGIAYVANRSGEFDASQAAGNSIPVYFLSASGSTIPVGGSLHDARYTNSGFIIADARDRAISSTNPSRIPGNPSISYSGEYIDQTSDYFGMNPDNLGAVYISADRQDAWFARPQGGFATINVTTQPTATAKWLVDISFRNFIKKSGTFVELPADAMVGDFVCGFDLGVTGPCSASQRLFHVEKGGSIRVPMGMPLYARRAATRPSLTVKDGTKTYGDPDVKLPGQNYPSGGTYSFYWNDVVVGANKNIEIVDIQFAPNQANRNPFFAPIADQTVQVGSTLTLTFSATDPDGDALTYSARALPTGASFTALSGVFTFSPQTSSTGVYPVTIRATDPRGGFADITVRITVVAASTGTGGTGGSGGTGGGSASTTPSSSLALGTSLASPSSQMLAMGSTNKAILIFRVSNGSTSPAELRSLVVRDSIRNNSNNSPSLKNYAIYQGSTRIAGPFDLSMLTGSEFSGAVALLAPITISGGSSVDLTLRADVASYASGQATSASRHVLTVTGGSLQGSAQSSEFLIVRSLLSVSAQGSTPTAGRLRAAIDTIGAIRFTADPAGAVTVTAVRLTFNGSALSSGTPFSVSLIDTVTGSSFGGSSTQACSPTPTSGTTGYSCSVTFLPTAPVAGGTTRSANVVVTSTGFANSSAADSLAVSLLSQNDVIFNDGSVSGFPLSIGQVPTTIFAGSYQ